MRWLSVLALLVPAAALADEAKPWIGVWTAEPEWCAHADRIGSHNPAPVQLTADEFLGYENSCAIRRLERVGALDAWQMELECQSEGSVYDDYALLLTEGRDVLWWFQGVGEPVRFTRCP